LSRFISRQTQSRDSSSTSLSAVKCEAVNRAPRAARFVPNLIPPTPTRAPRAEIPLETREQRFFTPRRRRARFIGSEKRTRPGGCDDESLQGEQPRPAQAGKHSSEAITSANRDSPCPRPHPRLTTASWASRSRNFPQTQSTRRNRLIRSKLLRPHTGPPLTASSS
jgi:hypothetical protein